MAARMRWTLGLLGACAVAVLLARLAIANPLIRYGGDSDLWRLRQEIAANNRALVQWAALDSVRSLLPDSPGVRLLLRSELPPSLAAAPGLTPQLSDSTIAAVEAAVHAQLADMGGSAVRLALVALPALRGGHADVEPSREPPLQYFTGRDERGTYCAVVVGVYGLMHESDIVRLLLAGGNPLGPCRFWARYGEPGAGVAPWLQRAGHTMLRSSPLPPDPPRSRRGLFGLRRFDSEVGNLGPLAQSCLAGRAAACRDAVLDPEQWGFSFTESSAAGPALVANGGFRWRGRAEVSGLLTELERELGAGGFARFWRSEVPAEDALGRELRADFGEWLVGWARARLGVEPRGPIVGWRTLVLSLLALGGLVGAAIAVAQRRQIG